MLDIIGAISLTSVAFLVVGTLVVAGVRDTVARKRLAWIGGAWFVTVATLGAAGLFSASGGIGTLAIGASVVLPLLAAMVVLAVSPAARSLALGIPTPVLVGVNATRVAGALFLMLYAAGRLPPTFALTAGWGDIIVGAAALPLAWAIHRRVAGWQGLTFVWTSIGLADLVTALTLGVGSAPDSPLRFIMETPDSGAIGSLPWLLIPGFLVPVFMLTHFAVFAQLAAGAAHRENVTLRTAA